MQRSLTHALTALTLALPAALHAQAANEQRLAMRDDLLAADRAVADTAHASGLGAALAWSAQPDLVLLYPGAPIVAGREPAVQLVNAQDALRLLKLRWVPLYAEVSADGSSGISWGVTAISATTPNGPVVRLGKYLSAWKHGPDGWHLVAHAQVGLLPASVYTPTPGARRATNAIPPSGAVADFARADSSFAAQAGREGAAAAFSAWCAADATVFPGTGELVRGADAIRRLFGERTQTSWRWAPVLGGSSNGGDLGFTVGEAVIAPADGAPAYTKYLTLWRRESDGRIRFVADGGNARPAQ